MSERPVVIPGKLAAWTLSVLAAGFLAGGLLVVKVLGRPASADPGRRTAALADSGYYGLETREGGASSLTGRPSEPASAPEGTRTPRSEAGQKNQGTGQTAKPAGSQGNGAEEYFLSLEYQLARKPSFYFVLDLGSQVLELRVRGMTLRKWPISKVRFWGEPAFRGESGTLELERKSALKVPERNVIKPGQAETITSKPGEFELKALELKDMPDRFDLYFKSGLHIRVTTTGKGGLPAKFRDAFKWYVILPLGNLFSSGKGKASAELEISVKDRQSAQSIYWIFFEKIEGYIR